VRKISKSSILIVDDDELICETLFDIFQEKGFNVAIAKSGHEGISVAEHTAFDVALIDIILPDMNGLDLLREFKKDYPEKVYIIITANATLQTAIRALKDGATDYFIKPLVIDEILSKTQDELEKKRLQRELIEKVEEIDEVKKAVQELKKSEEKYKIILNGIVEGVWVSNKDDIIYYTNKGMEKIAGIPSEQIVNVKVLIDFSESTLQYFRPFYLEAKNTLKSVFYDSIPVETPAGRKSFQSGWLIPIEKEGKYGGMICTVEDITESKKIEEDLRKSKELFRNLTINSPDVIYSAILSPTPPTFNLKYISPSIYLITGYTPDNFYNDPELAWKVIHPDDRLLAEEALNSSDSRPKPVIERWIRKDGKMIWVEVRFILIRDAESNLIEVQGIVRDITKRKRFEQKLKDSEIKYRSLFEHAPDSIILIDTKTGDIVDFNDQMNETLGYTREEFKNLKIPDFDLMENLKEYATHIEKAIRDGSDLFETKYLTKSGEVRDILVNINLIKISGKNYLQSILRDITDRKKTERKLKESEDELRKLNRELEQKIEERTREIRELAKFPSENPNFVLRVSEKRVLYTNDVSKNLFNIQKGSEIPDLLREYVKDSLSNNTERMIELEIGERIYSFSVNPIEDTDYVNLYGRDITEFKKSDKALKVSELMLQKSQEIGRIGSFEMDLATSEVMWSDQLYKLFGLKKEGKAIDYEKVLALIHPDDRERAIQVSSDAVKERKPYTLEHRVIHPDGRILNLLITGDVMRNEKNEIVKIGGITQDITESKKVTEELRLHSEIMTNMSEGVYLVRLKDLIIVYANPRFEEMFGYDPGEMIGKYVVIVNAPTDKTPEEVKDEIVGILNDTGEWYGDVLNIKKDGTQFWCYANVSIFDHPEYGRVMVSVHTNITERKKKEEELRLQSEIIENMSEGVYLIKLDDGTIVYTNPTFERMFGYNPDEMIGKNVAIVNAPTDKTPEETRETIMGFLKETGEWHGEVLNVKKDGVLFWCYANVSLFDHPDYGTVIVSIHTDITERKKTEQDLKESEQYLSGRVKELTCLYGLSKLFEKPGVSIDEIILGTLVLIPFAMQFPEIICTRINFNGKEYKANNFNESKWNFSNQVKLDGKLLEIEVFYLKNTPFLKEEVSLLNEIGNRLKSIIEYKILEDKLIRKEKLATIGTLIGSIGHELRNPLGVINNSVYFLNQRIKDKDEKVAKHLNILQMEVNKANAFISDLLDFIRIRTPIFKDGSINNAIENVVDELIIPKNIILERKLDVKLPRITFDLRQMKQVFHNLILNAIQAMPKGGILEIKTLSKEEFVEIKIKDSGMGISEENLDRIFEPLFTTKVTGIGLGLTIVKEILEKHGGTVEAMNNSKGGTIFTLRLPLKGREL